MSKPRVYISAEQISTRISELAGIIRDSYTCLFNDHRELVVIGVLKGAAFFTTDLVRKLELPVQLEFVRISSYGDGTRSNGNVSAPDLHLPADVLKRHILVVEDIVDTGYTARFLLNYLRDQFSPQSLKLVSLLDKPSRRVIDLKPDFCGFEIDDKFVVGYGLDYAERFRELSYLGEIEGVS